MSDWHFESNRSVRKWAHLLKWTVSNQFVDYEDTLCISRNEGNNVFYRFFRNSLKKLAVPKLVAGIDLPRRRGQHTIFTKISKKILVRRGGDARLFISIIQSFTSAHVIDYFRSKYRSAHKRRELLLINHHLFLNKQKKQHVSNPNPVWY